jgi:hypothetical protein
MESTLLDMSGMPAIHARGIVVRQSDSGFHHIFGSDPELIMSES